MFSSLPNSHSVTQRAEAGRRQPRENRDRVDVALVEHAEHDVDDADRDEQQQAEVAASTPGTPSPSPRSSSVIVGGSSCVGDLLDVSTVAAPSETPGRRPNEIDTDGSWPEWLTDLRADGFLEVDDRLERHQRAASAS